MRRPCATRWPGWRRTTWPATNAFWQSEAIYKVGFEQLGDIAFESWADMLRVLPDLLKLGVYRTVYQMACKHVQDRSCVWC